MIENEGLLPV